MKVRNSLNKALKLSFACFFILKNTAQAEEFSEANEEYLAYPKYIYFEYDLGLSSKIKLVSRQDQKGLEQGPFNYKVDGFHNLFFQRLGFYVTWCQISKIWTKTINAYPSIGFGTKYTRLSNKGNIISTFFYFSLEKDYWRKLDIFPSLSIGLSYMSIPIIKPKSILIPDGVGDNGKLKVRESDEPESDWHKVKYRSGFGIEISPAIETIIRLSDNYALKLILGLSYLPSFSKISKEETKKRLKKVDIENKEDNDNYKKRKEVLYSEDTSLVLPFFGISFGFSKNNADTVLYLGSPNKDYLSVSSVFSWSKYDINLEYEINKGINESKGKQGVPKFSKSDSKNIISSTRDRYSYHYSIGLNSTFYKAVGDYNSLLFGLLINFDSGIYKIFKNLEINKFSVPLKVSLEVGHSFIYGKLNIEQLLGCHIYSPAFFLTKYSGITQNLLYAKIIISYRFFEGLSIGLGIPINIKAFYDDRKMPLTSRRFSFKKIYKYDLELLLPEVRLAYFFSFST